jgi:transcriptional regulator with XRE-family HTH domain
LGNLFPTWKGENMNPEWFAGRLRELRNQAGLTQDELAAQAGVKRDAVARWEAGRREPSWGNILALCEALGVDCTAFIQEPQSTPAPERGRPRKTPKVEDAAPGKPAKKKRKK